MNILSHTGSQPYIGHFQGNAMKKYTDVLEDYSKKRVCVSPKIAVIMAYNNKEEAITALQLELNNQLYINACQDFEKKWSNIDKIKYYVDALSKTTNEYSLLVDAFDVLFFKDIDESFIEKFKLFNKNIAFNATKNNYPNMKISGESLGGGEFKYLNAGIVFGYTEDLLRLYKEILDLTLSENIINPWESEQLYVRLGALGKENIAIDDDCVLFQTFSKTQRVDCGNNCIII